MGVLQQGSSVRASLESVDGGNLRFMLGLAPTSMRCLLLHPRDGCIENSVCASHASCLDLRMFSCDVLNNVWLPSPRLP